MLVVLLLLESYHLFLFSLRCLYARSFSSGLVCVDRVEGVQRLHRNERVTETEISVNLLKDLFFPGQVAQLVGVSFCQLKRFESRSGHTPRWQVWYLIRVCMGRNLLIFFFHISVSLSLPQINKHIFGWRLKNKINKSMKGILKSNVCAVSSHWVCGNVL